LIFSLSFILWRNGLSSLHNEGGFNAWSGDSGTAKMNNLEPYAYLEKLPSVINLTFTQQIRFDNG
jgi:hypothetical protein